MQSARKTPADRQPRPRSFVTAIMVLALLLPYGVAWAGNESEPDNRTVAALEQRDTAAALPGNIALFDLHDPWGNDSWAAFLATTPMLNGVLLPSSLQDRLASVVQTYRFLTPDDEPAFFVATYFDLLSERLFSIATDDRDEIFPTRVCPVFANATNASVSKLLAVASGLPEELFLHTAGQPERYRYLFLQTEFSHCRFLAKIMAADKPSRPLHTEGNAAATSAHLTFDVGELSYSAILSTRKELRALLETIGDIDAISAFRREIARGNIGDEAEILIFIRLLSLLATEGTSGYAAIPVLLPMVTKPAGDGHTIGTEPLRIADVLDLAYQAREAFGRIAPFAIRDTQDLLNAKLAVMRALAEPGDIESTDARVMTLLSRFVTGSDLLLATAADEKIPLTND